MRWHVAAVVALAVLSGCAGSFDQDPTPTVTPVDVPTLGPESTQYPAGLEEDGISSVSSLAEGHTRALGGQPYTWEVRKCREYVRNGSVVAEKCGSDRITYVDETTYRWNHSAGPESARTSRYEPPTSRDSYADGTVVFRRYQASGRVSYDRGDASDNRREFSATARRFVQQYLSVNRSTVERVEGDDRTVYRVVGEGHRVRGYSTARDYRVLAIVEPSGLVRELGVSYTRTYGNLTMRTTVRSEYRDVGDATVEAPSWIEAARENVSAGG